MYTDIFNTSLETCPACFKTSTIIPLPQKTRTTGLNNFRPVVLTSVVMKSFESLVLSHNVNSHRPLSQQFIYLHRRVQKLPCQIFAKTWTAHRPLILMLHSLLLETSIRLYEFHQHMDCATRGIHTLDHCYMPFKNGFRAGSLPYSGRATMWPSCWGQSM